MHRLALLCVLPLLVGCLSTPPDYSNSGKGESDHWLAKWEHLAADLADTGKLAHEKALHTGVNMDVNGIYVRSRLDPPLRPAAEVVIVVEGQGLLEAGEERFALQPGNIALLPRGTRGAIYGDETAPLLALVLRAREQPKVNEEGLPVAPLAPAGAGKPTVLGEAEVFPTDVIQPKKGNAVKVIGTVPGAFTVRIAGVSGVIDPHVHLEHDELVFMIDGWGTLGMGTEGTARHFISHPFRERNVAHLPAQWPHSYADESGRSLAISVYAPELADPKTDTYPIKKREKNVGETRAFAPSRKKDGE